MADFLEERGYWEILEEARQRFPSSAFLKKCQEYYNVNKRLTSTQIEKLDSLKSIKTKHDSFFVEEDWSLDEILSEMVNHNIISEVDKTEIWAIDMAEELLEETFEVSREKIKL